VHPKYFSGRTRYLDWISQAAGWGAPALAVGLACAMVQGKPSQNGEKASLGACAASLPPATPGEAARVCSSIFVWTVKFIAVTCPSCPFRQRCWDGSCPVCWFGVGRDVPGLVRAEGLLVRGTESCSLHGLEFGGNMWDLGNGRIPISGS